MDFSFGIITTFGNESNLFKTIESITSQNIENYEIIIVGGSGKKYQYDKNIVHLKFDETTKEMWITRKKNLIIEKSNFDNIVFLHDYVLLNQDWHEGYLKFGNDFQVCTNKIINLDGTRFRDWSLSPNNFLSFDKKLNQKMEYLIPYSERTLSKYMYISGAYWVAKKDFMLKNKLNENLTWGQGEDVEWSHRVRKKINFKFNEYASVSFLKQKDVYFSIISQDNLKLLNTRTSLLDIFDKILIPFRRFKKKKKFFKYF